MLTPPLFPCKKNDINIKSKNVQNSQVKLLLINVNSYVYICRYNLNFKTQEKLLI